MGVYFGYTHYHKALARLGHMGLAVLMPYTMVSMVEKCEFSFVFGWGGLRASAAFLESVYTECLFCRSLRACTYFAMRSLPASAPENLFRLCVGIVALFVCVRLQVEDSGKHWAYVNVCRFICAYDTPPKIILQVRTKEGHAVVSRDCLFGSIDDLVSCFRL